MWSARSSRFFSIEPLHHHSVPSLFVAWGSSFPGVGLGICPSWISRSSHQLIPLSLHPISLDSSHAHNFIDWPWFGAYTKLMSKLCIDKDQRDKSQHRSLQYSTCCLTPGRVKLINHEHSYPSSSLFSWLSTHPHHVLSWKQDYCVRQCQKLCWSWGKWHLLLSFHPQIWSYHRGQSGCLTGFTFSKPLLFPMMFFFFLCQKCVQRRLASWLSLGLKENWLPCNFFLCNFSWLSLKMGA